MTRVPEMVDNLDAEILGGDYIELPNELKKTCTKDEFHKMMTSHNSDIPIENVKFMEYPDASV